MIVSAKLDSQSSLHVLYVGAELECDMLPVFGELADLLPEMQITMTMVGDNIADSIDGSHRLGCGGNLLLTLHKARAEFFLEAVDFVVGLNAGFEAYPQWEPFLRALVCVGTPAYFTDYSFCPILNSIHFLKILDGRISDGPRVNPFRSPQAQHGNGLSRYS